MYNKVERAAVAAIARKTLSKIKEERIDGIVSLIETAKKIDPNTSRKEYYEKAMVMFSDPENRWYKLVSYYLDNLNPNVAQTAIMSLGYDAFFVGTKEIRKNREKYGCNIPWLILFDPTSACNMHCIGCWAGTYGNKNNLTPEDMDSIVTQGKQLGVYLYMLTGGEPLIRKKDILDLAAKHSDATFAIYTNSTLIDEEFCKSAVECGNIMFLVSIEGSEETNDARRGAGHYQKVLEAMSLMKKYGLLFGTSVCYTSKNIDAVTSDKFLNMLTDCGAHFGFYFHYMPVGHNADTSLLPTPEQRKYMLERIRYIRSADCNISFYPMDFQNDGQYVGGCIAGGRNYFHINSAGDAEPCVFIHYSDSNIHDKTLLECLQSPLFMKYYHNQPFNSNHLRPCPMLENPQMIKAIVDETGAKSTNLEAPESVDDLTAKCVDYAYKWEPYADKIWSEIPHGKPYNKNYSKEMQQLIENQKL